MRRLKNTPLLALVMMLPVGAACHSDYPPEYYAGLDAGFAHHVANSRYSRPNITESPADIDIAFFSRFPRRNAQAATFADIPPASLADMTEPQTVFRLPVDMQTSCFGQHCGSGIDLAGTALMEIDLNQRRVTLHEFDLINDSHMVHLSGEITMPFTDLDDITNTRARAMLSLATPQQVITTDATAAVTILDPNLAAGLARIQFQGTTAGIIFTGTGVTRNQ